MMIGSPSGTRSKPRARTIGRWIAVLLVSALLHVLAIEWIGGNLGLPAWRTANSTQIVATLRTPPEAPPAPAVAPIPAPVAPAAPKRAPRPKPKARPPAPVAAPAPSPAPELPPNPAATQIAAGAPVVVPDEVSNSAFTEGSSTQQTPSAAQAVAVADLPAQSELTAPLYKVDPPPSADLKYDVQALRDGNIVYGRGKISWRSDGGNYTVDGEAGILFLTVLTFRSSGQIDDSGVAPVLYAEKRFRRSETNTHFQRSARLISFSASTASYPLKGGEQDRASIIWQLTGIGRGDQGKFIPGAEIEFFVAGVRDAEPWRIRVIGEEEIETGSGKFMAWHVTRTPRAGSYEQKLDIWLAPQQGWYPVKLRFTENNGDYLDMSLSNLALADNPGTAR